MKKFQFTSKHLTILVIIWLFAVIFSVLTIVNATNDDWLDFQCQEMNYSFSQCLEFRNSFNFTFEQSNETQLIIDTKNELLQNISENKILFESLFSEFKTNTSLDFQQTREEIQSINQRINNVTRIELIENQIETNREEQKEINEHLTKGILELRQNLNKLNLNTSNEDPFDLTSIIRTQTQIQLAREVNNQLKDIFQQEDEKISINLDNYYNKSELDTRVNNLPKPHNVSAEDFETFNNIIMLYFLIAILLVAIAFLYYQLQEQKKLIEYNTTKIDMNKNPLEEESKEQQKQSIKFKLGGN